MQMKCFGIRFRRLFPKIWKMLQLALLQGRNSI
jgi:hypothetical protein